MNKYKVLFLTVILLSVFSCSENSEETWADNKENNNNKDTAIVIDLSDNELLDFTQKQTLKYFLNYAEESSGAARERYVISNPSIDQNIVTTGGSGFGIMAIIAGIERGFTTSDDGFNRLRKIIDFFEKADRFHGVWPHWLDGRTGKVVPFSEKDNGGDLVETSFLAQALIVLSEYYKNGTDKEIKLSEKANKLWEEIEWSWYTNNQNTLYWHWSPNYNWDMSLKIEGYNECLITYLLAAASPTYPISKEVYNKGWARSGVIKSSNIKYGYPLVVRHAGAEEYGGPLFWSHYSFLALNPNGLYDAYVNYGDAAKNHVKINYEYCVQNPVGYSEYGKNCWGLTASYSRGINGSLSYAAHNPKQDLGVISPTASISSIVYTPEESMAALRYFYYFKNQLLGPAGFYDAFSPHYNFWVAEAYLAIDQGPIIIMIENYRSGLLWSLFMSNSEVKEGMKKLGFQSPNL